jgi:hypothetical protein
MTKLITQSLLSKVLFFAVLATQLLACGGGGGSSTSDADESVINDVAVSGSVGDGPVTGATIEVWSSKGKMIGTMTSDNTASFNSNLKVRGNDYPLLLKVRGGIDLVTGKAPDFQMVSVMQKPSEKWVNINPFTTLIVKIADAMPGSMATNISAASDIVLEKLGFGFDPNIIADPILTEITNANVAHLVKASEALGEMVRRTRDLVSGAGNAMSGDAVVAAIAADMTDGFLDGQGRSGANTSIAAVANVVSGQVLVEALSNNLKVDGVIATVVIDQSIMTTRPGITSSELTGSVRVTQGMLNRAQVSLAAARVLDSSVEVVDLAKTISGITAGSLPDEVVPFLPADSSRTLDNVTLLSSTASDADLANVNQVVVQVESGLTDPVATDPVATDPVATDPVATDPVATDPGSTDQLGNLTLNWTAPTTRADGTPLSLADIDGYRIYYGDNSGNYPNVVNVPDGSTQSANVNNIPVGIYYLVMTTYDNTGLESQYSVEITKAAQ